MEDSGFIIFKLINKLHVLVFDFKMKTKIPYFLSLQPVFNGKEYHGTISASQFFHQVYPPQISAIETEREIKTFKKKFESKGLFLSMASALAIALGGIFIKKGSDDSVLTYICD